MTKVFISYSHKDARWLERLMVHLRPLEGIGHVDLWADTRIKPGSKWVEEIETALATANVAVLLVSGHFIDSRFIASTELPKLLRAAAQRSCRIVPIVVEPCLFSELHELQQFHAINPPERPLAKLGRPDAEEFLVKAAKTILHSVHVPEDNAQSPPASQKAFASHYNPDAGVGLDNSGPSASEFVAHQVGRMISDLDQTTSLSDRLIKELIDKNLTGRDQLLRPLASYFRGLCDCAQENPLALPQTHVVAAAKRFLNDCHRAQAEISRRTCDILQNNQTGLVEVIVLADFSILVAKALSLLAMQNPQKMQAVEICLVLSSKHFSVQGDTERWEAEFHKDHMQRFYRFEQRVPFDKLDAALERIGRESSRAMVLMGVERAYPQGQFLDLPGMGRVINTAKMHSMDVVIAAECYKVQPLLAGEIRGTGIAPDGNPIELTPVDIGPGLYFVTDHAIHTAKPGVRDRQVSLKCCYRFWRNRMEDSDYPIGVIFDLDGTIVDSEDVHKALYQEAARSLGYELTDSEYFSKLRGLTDEETFKRIFQFAGRKGTAARLIAEKQRKFYRFLTEKRLKPVDGVIEHIQALDKQGHELALATSATKEEARMALRNFGLSDAFHVVISAEDVAVGKPSPDVYLKAAEALRLSPSECLVYEDSISGIRAALASKIRVVAVGDIHDESLRQAGAHTVIPNFTNHRLPRLTQ